jgi:hypothetical protein
MFRLLLLCYLESVGGFVGWVEGGSSPELCRTGPFCNGKHICSLRFACMLDIDCDRADGCNLSVYSIFVAYWVCRWIENFYFVYICTVRADTGKVRIFFFFFFLDGLLMLLSLVVFALNSEGSKKKFLGMDARRYGIRLGSLLTGIEQ